MACGSCGTGEDGKPRGCKSNGSCTSGGCEKLSVFDWLSNMTLPGNETPFNIYDVNPELKHDLFTIYYVFMFTLFRPKLRVSITDILLYITFIYNELMTTISSGHELVS